MKQIRYIPTVARVFMQNALIIVFWMMVGCRSEQTVFQFGKALPLKTRIDTAVSFSPGHSNHQIIAPTQTTLLATESAQITSKSKSHSHNVTGKSRVLIVGNALKESRAMLAKMRNLKNLSAARYKLAAKPQDPDFDFLVIPLYVFLSGVLLLVIALVGTWFGGGPVISTIAIAGLLALILGFILALIPILTANFHCFYCL